MNLKHLKIAYFIGIGGIGMSAIARYFKAIGVSVYGYDKTQNEFTNQLSSEGFIIHYTEDIQAIPNEIFTNPDESIVIYTPAIPMQHKELLHLKASGVMLYKRAQVLGLISQHCFTIAVAGTHGKTTTSSLIAHILNENNINFTAFLGGISTNLNSNYFHKTDGKELLSEPIMVVEADEYDRSFLHLTPNISIVTSTDADHLDIYGKAEEVKNSFQDFANKTVSNGCAILQEELELSFAGKLIHYGNNTTADASYDNIQIENHQFTYNFQYKDIKEKIICGLPGFHNIANATAALTACLEIIHNKNEELINAIKTFKGVKRRFEYILQRNDIVYIDDYAHHPTELMACITSVKKLFPNKKLLGIFQPHLYSRTRDFADDFANALNQLDECWLLEIYPAREMPIPGINSALLANKMKTKVSVLSNEEVLSQIKTQKPSLLLTLGAGNIDALVQPIKNLYE